MHKGTLFSRLQRINHHNSREYSPSIDTSLVCHIVFSIVLYWGCNRHPLLIPAPVCWRSRGISPTSMWRHYSPLVLQLVLVYDPLARHLPLLLPPHIVGHIVADLHPLVVNLILFLAYPVKWTNVKNVSVLFLAPLEYYHIFRRSVALSTGHNHPVIGVLNLFRGNYIFPFINQNRFNVINQSYISVIDTLGNILEGGVPSHDRTQQWDLSDHVWRVTIFVHCYLGAINIWLWLRWILGLFLTLLVVSLIRLWRDVPDNHLPSLSPMAC